MISIMIVDDQPLFVDGIQMVLESQPDFEVVGTAPDGASAVAATAALQPDVVLMDIRMPGMDGIRATEAIRSATPAPPPHIIVLTTIRHDRAVIEALRVGASGFLLKDATPEFLSSAIRTVVEGQQVIAPAETFSLLRAAAYTRPAPNLDAIAALTERERELFALAARGRSNADIATELFLAEATVKSHMRAILGKLALATRIQLIAFAYEHHLVN